VDGAQGDGTNRAVGEDAHREQREREDPGTEEQRPQRAGDLDRPDPHARIEQRTERVSNGGKRSAFGHDRAGADTPPPAARAGRRARYRDPDLPYQRSGLALTMRLTMRALISASPSRTPAACWQEMVK
jgi:hypothetical protein